MERAIEMTTTLRASASQAREILVSEWANVFGDGASPEERRTRELRSSLTLDLAGGASFSEEVVLSVGRPVGRADGVLIPLSWRPLHQGRLFPTFHGEMEVVTVDGATVLGLRGSYIVPLGVLGRFGDGVAGRTIARRCLAHLVTDVARRVDAEVAERLHVLGWHGANYQVDVRDGHLGDHVS